MRTETREIAGGRRMAGKTVNGQALLAAWFAISAGMPWLSLWVTRPAPPPAAVSERAVACEMSCRT